MVGHLYVLNYVLFIGMIGNLDILDNIWFVVIIYFDGAHVLKVNSIK